MHEYPPQTQHRIFLAWPGDGHGVFGDPPSSSLLGGDTGIALGDIVHLGRVLRVEGGKYTGGYVGLRRGCDELHVRGDHVSDVAVSRNCRGPAIFCKAVIAGTTWLTSPPPPS